MHTILVVDDDPTVRTMHCLLLTRKGYLVLEAANGSEAEFITEGIGLDLILLDIMMPVQDGFVTCANLRTKGYAGQILFVSAFPGMDNEKARQHGANGYIPKPTNSTVLWSSVADALRVIASSTSYVTLQP
jgi:two-component system, OmpR family, response regulator